MTESRCMSQLAIDEWNTGDDSADAHREHAEHLANCDRCRQRVADSAAQSEAFLRWAPKLEVLAKVAAGAPAAESTRTATVSRFPRRALAVATSLAVAAAALLIARPSTDVPGTRTKGSARLGVYIQRDGHVRRGGTGDSVRPGDTLRFVYTSSAAYHLAVFGDDGRGLTQYHPAAGEQAVRASVGSDVALDFGVELDDSLGTETFYAVFCSGAVSTKAIAAALSREHPRALPTGCFVDSLQLRKEAMP